MSTNQTPSFRDFVEWYFEGRRTSMSAAIEESLNDPESEYSRFVQSLADDPSYAESRNRSRILASREIEEDLRHFLKQSRSDHETSSKSISEIEQMIIAPWRGLEAYKPSAPDSEQEQSYDEPDLHVEEFPVMLDTLALRPTVRPKSKSRVYELFVAASIVGVMAAGAAIYWCLKPKKQADQQPAPPVMANDNPKNPPVHPETIPKQNPVIVNDQDKKPEVLPNLTPPPVAVPPEMVMTEPPRELVDNLKSQVAKFEQETANLPQEQREVRRLSLQTRIRQQLTEKYPNFKDEALTAFLDPTQKPGGKPVESPLPATPADRGALLAEIAKYPRDKPLPVRDAKLMTLRNEAADYQKTHADEKNPEIEDFVRRSALTADHEKLYAELKVEELKDRAADSPEIRELRSQVIGMRLTWPLEFAKSKVLSAFLTRTKPKPKDVDGTLADLDAVATALVNNDAFSDQPQEPHRRYLLSALPPSMRNEAKNLLIEGRKFAYTYPDKKPSREFSEFLTYARQPDDTVKLLVPAFFYFDDRAGDNWKKLALAAQKVETVAIVDIVMDVDDPGPFNDKVPQGRIEFIQGAGVNVIGRIDAGGNKSAERLFAEVKLWHQRFPTLGGIFIDQHPGTQEEWEKTKGLVAAIKANFPKDAIVICSRQTKFYGRYADLKVVLCDTHTGADPRSYTPPDWAERYKPEMFAAISWGFGRADEDTIQKYAWAAADGHRSWLFLTAPEDWAPGGFRNLPKFWEEEVEAIRLMNRQIATGAAAQRRP